MQELDGTSSQSSQTSLMMSFYETPYFGQDGVQMDSRTRNVVASVCHRVRSPALRYGGAPLYRCIRNGSGNTKNFVQTEVEDAPPTPHQRSKQLP